MAEFMSPRAQRAWTTMVAHVLDPKAVQDLDPKAMMDAVLLFNSVVPQIQRMVVSSGRKLNFSDLRRLASLDTKDCYAAGELQSVGMPPEDIVAHLLRPALPTQVLRAVEAQTVFDSPRRPHLASPHRSLSPAVAMISSTLAAGTTHRSMRCTQAYARAVEEYRSNRSQDTGPLPVFARAKSPNLQKGKQPATVSPRSGGASRRSTTPNGSSRECPSCNPAVSTTIPYPYDTPPRVFMGGMAVTRTRDDVGEVLQKLHMTRSPAPRMGSEEQPTTSDMTLSPRRVRRWLDAFNGLLRQSQLTVEQFHGLPSAQQTAYFTGWRIAHVKQSIITQAVARHMQATERVGTL